MMDVLVEFIKTLGEIWESANLRDRFVYTYWGFLLFMYIYSNQYDSYHNPERDRREPVHHNFSFGVWLSAVISIIPYVISIISDREFILSDDIKLSYTLGTLGFILLTIGLTFAILGRVALDGQWGPNIYTVTEKLQTEHIYGWIRHPIYFGQFNMALGTFLVVQSWWIIIFPISTALFAFIRATNEEQYLEEAFSTDFLHYKKTVHGWLPTRPKKLHN